MEIMSRAIFDVVAEKRTAGSLQPHKCCFGFAFNVGRIMNILIIDGKSFLCLSITVHICTLEGRFHFHLLKSQLNMYQQVVHSSRTMYVFK